MQRIRTGDVFMSIIHRVKFLCALSESPVCGYLNRNESVND